MKNIMRVVFLAVTLSFMMLSSKTLCIGFQLWSISDSITYLESYASWSDEDKALYDEIQGRRQASQEAAAGGGGLVVAGAAAGGQLLRLATLIIALFLFFVIPYTYCEIIKHLIRRHQKIKRGKLKRAYMRSLSKKFR